MELAERIACVPYDVIDTEEARAMAEGNPKSFLHIIRPEIDLPARTGDYDDIVYKQGAENLEAYARGPWSIQDEAPSLYVYRLIMDGRAQTGVYGCVSVDEYDRGLILKHENTRPDKEADRTRHIIAQRAHAEPVMLTFRDDQQAESLIARAVLEDPEYDFVSQDGVQHTVWCVQAVDEMIRAFSAIPKLYIADGHHRCKAASLAAKHFKDHDERLERQEYGFFPAVLFPMSSMTILPYHRVIHRLSEDSASFLNALENQFSICEAKCAEPEEPGQVCIYIDDAWYVLTLPETKRASVADTLDVARLSEYILEPFLDIQDPRTDKNIQFVGGIRGTKELERLVREGHAEVAFSMYPTRIEDLLAVSDAGLLMPPKSTWFEPKLRSGLLVHRFG